MNKNTFFVIEQREKATGKTAAQARKINNRYNLVNALRPATGFEFISINACDSYKEARAIANAWNNTAIDRGTYAFL